MDIFVDRATLGLFAPWRFVDPFALGFCRGHLPWRFLWDDLPFWDLMLIRIMQAISIAAFPEFPLGDCN